jgi:hypothetical protein
MMMLKTMSDLIHYFAPTKDFALSHGVMARQAFSDAFAHLYDPVPFAQFLEETYGAEARWSVISPIPPLAGRRR